MSPVRPVQVSPTSSLLPLEYPQSVAVFDNYEAAQKAVDFLSDHEFPVENLCIVGTDLKLVERVLGRRAWPQVLAGGAMSGLGTGVLLGLLWGLFMPGMGWGSAMLAGLVMGVIMGVLSAAMAHAAARGQRDFNSVTATVATRYEVLGEHKVVPRARQMLQEMPGFRAQQAAASTTTLPASPQTTAGGTSVSQQAAGSAYGQGAWPAPGSASVNPAQPQTPSTADRGSAPGATAWTSGASVPSVDVTHHATQQEPTQPVPDQPRPEPIYSPWPDHSADDPRF